MKISMLRRHVGIHNRKLKQDYVDILHVEVYHCSNAVCVLYTRALWMLAAYRVGETVVACCWML